MAIRIKKVSVEAHNSIRLVERYYIFLCRLYEIICKKLKDENIDKEMKLQMAIKAVNNTASPNSLVPTLLVFGTYL